MTTTERPAATLRTDRLHVRALGANDADEFRALAAESALPGLAEPDTVIAAPGCIVLLACDEAGGILGCSALQVDVVHHYIAGAAVLPFPLPNVYLFGAYVRPWARGRGVGSLLYRRRLALAELVPNGLTVVELLGDGTPGSVHPATQPGLHFHTAAGFEVIGYSPDPDGGLVLARKADWS